MSDVVYRIVEHDGGWAYKLGDVFSETFPSRQAAESAAAAVAAEQRVPGETEAIAWQDEAGTWHEEVERGSDRPEAYVEGQRPTTGPAPRTKGGPGSYSVTHLVLAGAVGALVAVLAVRRSSAD